MSLALMTGLSVLMLNELLKPTPRDPLPIIGSPHTTVGAASWAWLPFAFTIFGAGLGFLFELYLLVAGTPFQQTKSPKTTRILRIRLLNLAPVSMTIFTFIVCFTVGDPSLRLGLAYLAAAMGAALGLALYYGGAEKWVPFIMISTQVVQIVLVLISGSRPGGSLVVLFLVGQALLQTTAFLITTATPLRSAAFHVLSTGSGVLLYLALVEASRTAPRFTHNVAVSFPIASMRSLGLVIAVLVGLRVMGSLSADTRSGWRMMASNAIWSPLYFLLISQPRFPSPISLNRMYPTRRAPEPQALAPYYQVHPDYLTASLAVPAAGKLERNVRVFVKVVAIAKKAFSIITPLDANFPQANPSIPLAHKPRMAVWSDGSEYYPSLYKRTIGVLSVPGKGLEPTPEPAIDAFKEGQLLAYLTESGVGSPLARVGARRFRRDGQWVDEPPVVLDFSHLETYETKDEYESYGGMAYFSFDEESKRLRLDAVIAPHSDEVIPADPADETFRRTEAIVLASLYFSVICGKHLTEIHMTYNLVEVSMHNAFDAQGQWLHPFRLFMYLHLFSHELAEEMTTEHLIQEGGVFSQIFATTYPGMIDSINDWYRNFSYGEDEDFDAREALMTPPGHTKPTPRACICWELRYAEVFQRYTTSMIETIYVDDEAVRHDVHLRAFFNQLQSVIKGEMPERYDGFKTRAGVARYASDTIQHLVVRHQVYGTTGVRAAMDPRLSSPQVPRDGGPPGVDEWRSLISVALATARARFTLLMEDYTYLFDGVDDALRPGMDRAFERLQADLGLLQEEWTATDAEESFNYDYFRALPADLHTGPGY